MSKMNIGINGFGRIGRLVFRNALLNPNVEIVAINDLVGIDYLAYLMRYDSTHGKLNAEIRVEGNSLVVDGKPIRVTSERDPENLNSRGWLCSYGVFGSRGWLCS